ncbi:MAG: VOC family protein [Nocardioidaceae bacterium]
MATEQNQTENTQNIQADRSPGEQPPRPAVWPTLSYRDARAAIEFLTFALGFVEKASYADESDSMKVVHAQLDWPPGGGIMLGSSGRPEGMVDPTGHGSTYCVTDDVDAVFARAVAAGATVVREPADQDYGGRNCVLRDPEGNQWSFGSYRGE